MTGKVVELDVRDDIRNGREPFSKIMSAVAALGPDDRLLLVAPFEPVPLYRVMAKHGFCHAVKPLDGDAWEVLFIRQDTAPVQRPGLATIDGVCGCAPSSANDIEVDARGLEPPQPLVKILEALEALPCNATLRARTDRRPLHLYAQLETRGFIGETEERADGSFVTEIRRSVSP